MRDPEAVSVDAIGRPVFGAFRAAYVDAQTGQ